MENLGSLQPAPCNHKNWTGLIRSAAWKYSNANCEAGTFSTKGLIDALCQSHVKNTHKGWYAGFTPPEKRFYSSNSWDFCPRCATTALLQFIPSHGVFGNFLSFCLDYKVGTQKIPKLLLCTKSPGFDRVRGFLEKNVWFQKNKETKKLIKAIQILASAAQRGLRHPFVFSQWYLLYLLLTKWLRPLGFNLNTPKMHMVSVLCHGAIRCTDHFYLANCCRGFVMCL